MFSADRRPIVEFAIENIKILQQRQAAAAGARERGQADRDGRERERQQGLPASKAQEERPRAAESEHAAGLVRSEGVAGGASSRSPAKAEKTRDRGGRLHASGRTEGARDSVSTKKRPGKKEEEGQQGAGGKGQKADVRVSVAGVRKVKAQDEGAAEVGLEEQMGNVIPFCSSSGPLVRCTEGLKHYYSVTPCMRADIALGSVGMTVSCAWLAGSKRQE